MIAIWLLLVTGVSSASAAVHKIDTRDIVREAVLTALRNPIEEVENFLHKTESNFLSDAGRNLDDPDLLNFCNFVAVYCEDPSATSDSCGHYIRQFFHLTHDHYNKLIDAEILQDSTKSLTAFLHQTLASPNVEEVERIRLVSPLICEFIEYFEPQKAEQRLKYTPATAMWTPTSLIGYGFSSLFSSNEYTNILDDDDAYFKAALSLLAEARDFLYAPVAAGQGRRSIEEFFELELFKSQKMHKLRILFETSVRNFGIFNIQKMFAPFTDRMMKDIPDALWVRIAPGTSTLEVELREWDKREKEDGTRRAEFAAEWRRQWGDQVATHRGYRRANAFYTWTRVYVPGALMSMQHSLQKDKDYEAAIEADCDEFKLNVDLVKNLVIPGRSKKPLMSYGLKLVPFVLQLLTLGATESNRERVLNKSKILELVSRRMKVLYNKALQKEAQYLKEGVDLLALHRANVKFQRFDPANVPEESVIEILFKFIRGKFEPFTFIFAAL